MDLRSVLVLLMPRAIAWAESESAAGALVGRALSLDETSVATRVGVRSPERVRIVTVDALPPPNDAELRAAATQAGLLDPRMTGMTLGHTVFVRRGHETPRLVAHELRHVHQYEAAGGIDRFLPEYLRQVVEHGYANAPYEKDARAHETTA